MQIEKNSVVSLDYELFDSKGGLIDKSQQPLVYLHGGYDGIFPLVEEALHGKSIGDRCEVTMEPDNAFGDYEAELVRVEPRSAFPTEVKIGMQFETGSEDSDDFMVFTVTEIEEDKIVIDGNHPLAGMTLTFNCTVTDVRPATAQEIQHGHVHGAHGHHH